MPRSPRIHVPLGLYHATLRGNHRLAIFLRPGDYLRFQETLATALERYGARLLAYCWMTNHVHLAVQVGDAPLGEVMRLTASRYARQLQREVPTTGHLFERRYRARLVESDRYLMALVRYIHLNPVRASLVADPRDYRWSSHGAYLGDEACPRWLSLDPVLDLFGAPSAAARAAYRLFMGEAPEEDEVDRLRTDPRRIRSRKVMLERPDAEIVPARADRPADRLEKITETVADERGISVAEVLSRRRDSVLVDARVEVARRALREGAATLTQVARHLGRAPSTISELLNGPQ